jgi:hypothetical protein
MKSKHTPNAEREVLFKYAEEWLDHAVTGLRDHFAKFGHVVPPVHLSCGYSPDGFNPKRKRGNYDGMCMYKKFSKDKVNVIYIAPHITEPMDIMYVLAHELIHAVDDAFSGHGATFKSIARDIGLSEGGNVNWIDYSNTQKVFASISEPLGKYPRSGITYLESFCVPNPEYQTQRAAEKERKKSRERQRRTQLSTPMEQSHAALPGH